MTVLVNELEASKTVSRHDLDSMPALQWGDALPPPPPKAALDSFRGRCVSAAIWPHHKVHQWQLLTCTMATPSHELLLENRR